MTVDTQSLLDIAAALAEKYVLRVEEKIIAQQWEITIDQLKLALLPAEGWPGKNAEARDAARDMAYAQSVDLVDAQRSMTGVNAAIDRIDAQVAGLEADRRAIEWTIRADLVSALMAGRVQANGSGPRVEESWDDVIMQQAEAELPF